MAEAGNAHTHTHRQRRVTQGEGDKVEQENIANFF